MKSGHELSDAAFSNETFQYNLGMNAIWGYSSTVAIAFCAYDLGAEALEEEMCFPKTFAELSFKNNTILFHIF